MRPWDRFAEIDLRPAADADRSFAPAVDIVEEHDAVLVTVELPGVRPDDVSVDADAHVLTVHGQRRAGRPDAERYHRRERAFGAFSRTFALPKGVDGTRAVSIMADGLLTVRLPKVTDGATEPVRRAS